MADGIEELAKAIHDQQPYDASPWDNHSLAVRDSYQCYARAAQAWNGLTDEQARRVRQGAVRDGLRGLEYSCRAICGGGGPMCEVCKVGIAIRALGAEEGSGG